MKMPPLTWQKSSYSNEGANCIYVAATPDGAVCVCESDAPGTVLSTRPEVLRTLISGIKSDRFGAGPSRV
ncbi:DUF397 domain-containing protein [Streptomyces sp. NPDC050610]|uniref:DUF397 domain-containing protein n=1 Tax=Streptomyces sp. NPDC050610 TaxID=3157097 RepID=UPI0034361820